MDRVIFGSNHVYYFVNPLKPAAPEDTPKEITWEYAQKEVAEAKGFAIGLVGLTKEQQIVQEQILEILPMVSEVNAVSEELNKHKSFEVVLVPSAIQVNNSGKPDNGAQVMVKMKDLLNGNTWLWEHGKFMNRRYLIQEMYQKYLDGENMSSIPKEKDPFWEPAEDVLIGTANVFLQSLSYALDFADELSVTDYKGLEEGKLMISINPCDQSGLTLNDDNFVEDPKDLLDKPFHFKISIRSADIYKTRYSKGIKVKYRLLNDTDFTETKMLTGTLTPEFCHNRVVSIPKLKSEHLEFFESNSITFLVYGKQEDAAADHKFSKLTTKELRQMEQMGSTAQAGRRKSVFIHDTSVSDNSHLKTELVLVQRKYERLAQKEKRMMQLCTEWSRKPETEQQFQPFHHAVTAVAYSSGTRLKTRVHVVNQEDDGDTVSLFVFGEEEDSLAKEAARSNGVIDYNKVKDHHFQIDKSLHRFSVDGIAANRQGKLPNGSDKTSSTCEIM